MGADMLVVWPRPVHSRAAKTPESASKAHAKAEKPSRNNMLKREAA